MASGGNTDIDTIWQQMKQQQSSHQKKVQFESFWKNIQLGHDGKRRATAPADTQQAAVMTRQQPLRNQPSNNKQSDCRLYNSLTKGRDCMQLTCALQSLDGYGLKAALQQLQVVLMSPVDASGNLPLSKACKALLRCFDNRLEVCRELAISCLARALSYDPESTLGLLPYIVPVLEERLQTDESCNPTEHSEEVRLHLVQLLGSILEHAHSAVAAYASEVWTMLTAVLMDACPEVLIQGCKVSKQLAGILGLRLGGTSKELVAALLPLTTHRRCSVRIAAIHAIQETMHQGAHEMILEMVAWNDPNLVPVKAFYEADIKVNFCGKLATDPNVQVRLAFLDMVGNWMLTLQERLDHEARLLPYVLSSICDDVPVVVQKGLQLLDQLGQQYEQEHEKDLSDILRFADKVDSTADAYLAQCCQTGAVRYAGSWDVVLQAHADDMLEAEQGMQHLNGLLSKVHQVTSGATCIIQKEQPLGISNSPTLSAWSPHLKAGSDAKASTSAMILPGPLKERARIGTRLLVRGHFSSLLPALCRELTSWQNSPRVMSAKLLLVSLLLVESAAEQHLQVILPALCTAMCDAQAADVLQACATVLGCFVTLPQLLSVMQPRLEDWVDLPHRQASALNILAAALRGAGRLCRVQSHGAALLQLLLDTNLASSRDGQVRTAMWQVLQQLLQPHTLQQLCCGQHRICHDDRMTSSSMHHGVLENGDVLAADAPSKCLVKSSSSRVHADTTASTGSCTCAVAGKTTCVEAGHASTAHSLQLLVSQILQSSKAISAI